MSTPYYITSKGFPDSFRDNASKGDSKTYTVDFTPWQEANHTITSVTWTVESGNATLGTPSTASGVSSCLVSFPYAGRSLISVLATTATEKKKIWIENLATDRNIYTDDYGFNA